MATKYTSQSLRNLVKGVIFPQSELTQRQRFILGQDNPIHRIVVEFSSPNIAKPFHYGHLKSTIFGNFLSNLHTHLGIEVTRLNYIGDWGTQFGLLGLLLKQNNCDLSVIKTLECPMTYLVQKYVEANEKAKQDEYFFKQAKEHLKSLENDPNDVNPAYDQWIQIKSLSMEELARSYCQLGITFDVYDFESNYAQKSKIVVDQLLSRGHAVRLEDGAVIVKVKKNEDILDVPIIKSDGSSLYLSRDLAAFIDRKERFNFDRIFYVAGADQARHFHALTEVVKLIINQEISEHESKCADDRMEQVVHVKTGKVIRMSTRTGNFLLLSHLINEAKSRYVMTTKNTPTSKLFKKVDESVTDQSQKELDETAKQLALSAFFFYDLRFKRMRNYEFNWNAVMSDGSQSGLNLQATHARLCSLIRRCTKEAQLQPMIDSDMFNDATSLQSDCFEAINSMESIHLLEVMNNLNPILQECYQSLESAPLVNHSTALCRAINKARQSSYLRVLGETNDLKARSRLSLFMKARDQLALVIELMGLKPLEKV